jgi:hypothetical protein
MEGFGVESEAVRAVSVVEYYEGNKSECERIRGPNTILIQLLFAIIEQVVTSKSLVKEQARTKAAS